MTGDVGLLKQSRSTFDDAIDQIEMNPHDPDRSGFLTAELRRDSKALRYQAYAGLPMLAMAVLSRAYGCDFLRTPDQNRRMAAYLQKTFEGALDPEIFSAELARRGQAVTVFPASKATNLAYLAYSVDPKLFAAVDANLSRALDRPQPVVSPTTGANASNRRLGGRFSDLVEASDALRGARSPGLAKVCRQR
jgi:hypothetical protein